MRAVEQLADAEARELNAAAARAYEQGGNQQQVWRRRREGEADNTRGAEDAGQNAGVQDAVIVLERAEEQAGEGDGAEAGGHRQVQLHERFVAGLGGIGAVRRGGRVGALFYENALVEEDGDEVDPAEYDAGHEQLVQATNRTSAR